MISKKEITSLLQEKDPHILETLWQQADVVRQRNVGPAIHLRGLIEISNICRRSCCYCGLRAPNEAVKRYRMSTEEIIASARTVFDLGYGTVVMQAGEDGGITEEWLCQIISSIKSSTPLAVTLSLGERTEQELAAWKSAGADRYLLRFETSNRQLYTAIHPDFGHTVSNRIELLAKLKTMGYETGSGVMVGIPGQTYEMLTQDILLFRELDLDMIGIGPYIPHLQTPLGQIGSEQHPEQVPNTATMAYTVLALCRLVCPQANIPATTALATLNTNGYAVGLQRGANVVMPNVTPFRYRKLYEIYPEKACFSQDTIAASEVLQKLSIKNRTIGTGPGGRSKSS